ncbi:MAG: type II toxin-antitoxin system VapC family toxin [Actinobacteria bacterium]|nr:type II toxin-antitoxin system VapC family toxin [Actinomycetota bacterium]MCA1721590.1 type II toxin-antitoxin system VapC family toxin [Actinomycetota bacterium]
MLVVDASAAVELLLDTPRGRRVSQHLLGQSLIAPELLDVEVTSALARLQRGQQLTAAEADRLMNDLLALPVQRIPHRLLTAAAWQLRARVSVADAFYAACAAVMAGQLLTCDWRLARSALPGLTISLVQ